MALDLLAEFGRLVAALARHEIDYAVAGALAVAIHGAPRATTDIDLLVQPQDVPRVLDCARECGFTIEALPMRFRDGMELRRITKFSGADSLTLDLLLVDENNQPAWDSRVVLETPDGPLRASRAKR